VDVFQDTRQTGEQPSIFPCQDTKQLGKNMERVSERGKKIARLASGFVFLLANPEFFAFGELASGYPHPCFH
jgi:hypothetical protein